MRKLWYRLNDLLKTTPLVNGRVKTQTADIDIMQGPFLELRLNSSHMLLESHKQKETLE